MHKICFDKEDFKILAIPNYNEYLKNHKKQNKVKEYKREIDQMIYGVYGLTTEEIEIVENSLK